MNRKNLECAIQKMMADDLGLMRRKGHDYSGDEDALANLKIFGFFGVVVRLSDKMMRLIQFVKTGKQAVRDESIIDTLRDIRNYCYLAEVLFELENEGREK